MGDGIPTPNGHLVLEENLADGRWHIIRLRLMDKELKINYGEEIHRLVLKSKYTFNVEGFLYVGGIPQHTWNVLTDYKPSSNLRGCLRYVNFDRKQVLPSPTKVRTKYRVYGSPGNNCPREQFETVSFQSPDSYLFMPSPGKDVFNVQMQFRTYIANSVLAHKFDSTVRVNVLLRDGRVVLDVLVVGVSHLPQLIQGESLNDGEWHFLSVIVNNTDVKLKVDKLAELRHENPLLKNVTKCKKKVFIGHTYDNDRPNFVGCIHDLRVDDEKVKLRPVLWSRYAFRKVYNRCNVSSRCFPNPCRHGGECSDLPSGDFSCDCQKTFHRGRFCETPIYLRTCQEYKDLGLTDDAYCKVDPDDEGPIEALDVLCNMNDQEEAVTLIYHSRVGPQPVLSPKSSDFSLYFHPLKYSDLNGIKALIAQSERCRQLVSFNCFNSKLLQSPVGPAVVSWSGGGDLELVSDYWPGAPAGSMRCACGVNRTCSDPGLACNCDIGDEKWREDKGYVTDRAKLPVTYLQFSESAARSNFTVGPLECFGTLKNGRELSLQAQRDASRFLYSLCRPVNPTSPEPHPSSTSISTWEVQEETTSHPHAELSTKGERTGEVITSKPTMAHAAITTVYRISSPITFHETTQTVSDVNLHEVRESETTASAAMSPTIERPVLVSSESFGSALPPSNSSHCCSDGTVSFDQDASTGERTAVGMSWQIMVAWVLMIVVFVMFVLGIFIFMKRANRTMLPRCGFWGVSKQKKQQSLAQEEHGFPEVRLRSRSGELKLSEVRRSIDAGSYNVRTGIVAYGEPFYS